MALRPVTDFTDPVSLDRWDQLRAVAAALRSKEMRDGFWKLLVRTFVRYLFNPRKAFEKTLDALADWIEGKAPAEPSAPEAGEVAHGG